MVVSPGPLAPAPPRADYRPAIDGLRAVAVLAVFLFHLNRRWLPGGFVGVDIFFVVSGYLITSIIFRDCVHGHFRFARFYQRRIARLLPAFAAVAVSTLLVASFVYSAQDLGSAGATLSAAAASIVNLKLIFQGNYFALSPDAQPFLHCWSLSVEEQFYLLFPALFVLLYRKVNAYRTQILLTLCVVSLLVCIALTRVRPELAFYLLPSRAWELLAGSVLATLNRRGPPKSKLLASLPFLGLGLIIISFFIVPEGSGFPGYVATVPVLGAMCFFTPCETSGNLAERLLSWSPLVLVGRMSYSLYLWHWPVFSLVDYRFYQSSPLFRLTLKVLVSFIATALCFFFIEKPSRTFLNRTNSRHFAFIALGCSLGILIPLGIFVRNANYVDADINAITKGGLRFNQAAKSGSLVLMGDSNGSMYAKMAVELAKERDLRLTVVSMAGGDPLPRSSRNNPPLWNASLAVVTRERPDFLLFVCNWSRLIGEEDRLAIALRDLQQVAHFVILITQPPELPQIASRDGIRSGHSPPFIEDAAERAARVRMNNFVEHFQRDNVTVVNIESLFSGSEGTVRFLDKDKRLLYEDQNHLSATGANLVKPELIKVMINAPSRR